MMLREVTNRPGTCSVSTGSNEGLWDCSICSRPMTDTVVAISLVSAWSRVPVTTTSCNGRVSATAVESDAGVLALAGSSPPVRRMRVSVLFIILLSL